MITIQWDALLAEQFDMYYIDENGEKQRPYIIHRTSMGCYERTLAWLIEKYAGMFPTWLCPEQVRVIPISEKFHDYAAKVEAQLKKTESAALLTSVPKRWATRSVKHALQEFHTCSLLAPKRKKKARFP